VTALPQFHHFQVFDLIAIDGKPDDRANQMEAMLTGSAGVDKQQLKLRIEDHLQDMGMTCNQQLRWISLQNWQQVPVVMTGITTDMGHQHINSFTKETQILRKLNPEVCPIYITVDRLQWFYLQ